MNASRKDCALESRYSTIFCEIKEKTVTISYYSISDFLFFFETRHLNKQTLFCAMKEWFFYWKKLVFIFITKNKWEKNRKNNSISILEK